MRSTPLQETKRIKNQKKEGKGLRLARIWAELTSA
jgi:hypothetical protein